MHERELAASWESAKKTLKEYRGEVSRHDGDVRTKGKLTDVVVTSFVITFAYFCTRDWNKQKLRFKEIKRKFPEALSKLTLRSRRRSRPETTIKAAVLNVIKAGRRSHSRPLSAVAVHLLLLLLRDFVVDQLCQCFLCLFEGIKAWKSEF